MNHKWKNNVCIRCGVGRMKVSYKKWVRTYSKLVNGVFEDRDVYQYGRAWWYGKPVDPNVDHLFNSTGFDRPDCHESST